MADSDVICKTGDIDYIPKVPVPIGRKMWGRGSNVPFNLKYSSTYINCGHLHVTASWILSPGKMKKTWAAF